MLVALHPFRRKNPPARIPETAFPDPYFFTDTEHAIVDDIPTLRQQEWADLAPIAQLA